MTTTQTARVLYTAKVHTTGGREAGVAKSSDGRLDLRLSTPGGAGNGTNPEQLLAAGWSACFEGAIAHAARKMRIKLPADPVVDAEIDLLLTGDAFSLRARLNVALPGLERAAAQSLVDAAHQTCPYSKALHGNVDVTTNLV
jgi:Ohr subfamily peroxiredoxin